MLRSHFTIYLASRVASAALNLLSVAVFARLAGPEIYGQYLLVLASAIIAFGFSTQWACAAFFALYAETKSEGQIASFLLLIAFLLVLSGLVIICGGLLTGFHAAFLGALIAMAGGMALLEAATEIARTRLEPGKVAVAFLLRSVGTLVLGAIAILWFRTATSLALAVALANAIASLPCLVRFVPSVSLSFTLDAMGRLVRYGWPLILAFGCASLGQNIDRLLLASWVGPEDLGPYGAISDLIKQTFFVVGESVVYAFISFAKRAAVSGDHEHAGEILEVAFTSLLTVASFGAAFFLCFGPPIFELVFGAKFAHPAEAYFPILVVANALLTLRAFYFGQVIFFSDSSRLELWISLLTLAVSAVLSALLIPKAGALGAAFSLLGAQAAGCFGYAFAGRGAYRLPVPIGQGLAIIGMVLGFLLLTMLIDRAVPSRVAAEAINAVLFACWGLFTVYRFKLFGLRLDPLLRG